MRVFNPRRCNLPPFWSVAALLVVVFSLSLLTRPLWAEQAAGGAPGAKKTAPDPAAGKQPPTVPAKKPPVAPTKKPPVTPAKQQAPAKKQAAAEPPKSVDLPVEDRKREYSKIRGMLKAGNVQPADQAAFDDFYKKYALARWANSVESKGYSQLPRFRAELRRDLRDAAKAGNGTSATHQRLNALALDYLAKVAKSEDPESGNKVPLDPAARCSAMLAIGELNARDTSRIAELPEPLPEALSTLLEALGDAGQSDEVRIAALQGILRHAALDIADPQVRDTQVMPAMLTLAESEADGSRSVVGHHWIRMRAIDVLGELKEVGQQNRVVDALADIVAEEGGPLMPRRAAARALGMLKYPADSGLDPSQLAAGLGQVAVDACAAELVRIEEEQERERAKTRRSGPGMRGFQFGPGMDFEGADEMGDAEMVEEEYEEDMDMEVDEMGMGFDGLTGPRRQEEEEEDETLLNRRRLMAQVDPVMCGFTGKGYKAWNDWKRKNETTGPPPDGVGSLATAPPHQPYVKAVREQVESVLALCTKKSKEEMLGVKQDELSDVDKEKSRKEIFREKLEEKLAQLRQALASASAVAPDTTTPEPAGP